MEMPAKRRRDLLEGIIGSTIHTRVPEPPYQSVCQDLLFATFEIDPEVVRPFVPESLRLASSNTGGFVAYSAPTSWGIGPHERALLAVEIEGHDSPDTANGMFLVASVMNPEAAAILEPRYGGGTVPGRVQVIRENNVFTARAVVNGEVWIEAVVEGRGPALPLNSGIDRYLGQTPMGIVQHDIAFAGSALEGSLKSFLIGSNAGPAFGAVRPLGWTLAGVNPLLAGNWSAPVTLTINEDNEALSAHLELMDREGRPAVVFRGDGTPLRANSAARALLDETIGSELRDAVRAAVADSARVARPVLLACKGSKRPLLAHLMRVRPRGTIEDAVLALLVDTDVAQHRESVPLLRVLGLTNAEALLAELIGSGMSVRDAATASGISEHTARSTLKLVYAKLGISKSSQLGNLVARLRFV